MEYKIEKLLLFHQNECKSGGSIQKLFPSSHTTYKSVKISVLKILMHLFNIFTKTSREISHLSK